MAALAYTLDRLSFAELAVMLRASVKDQSYRATPVGTIVGRYIRWLRNEWGATPSTIRDYEAVLARMSLALADRELIEVTTEDLRETIDLWAAQSARTRQKITSIVRAFWSWCDDEGLVAINPAARIKRPRAERRVASALAPAVRPQLLTAVKHPRDRLGLFCLLVLGVRRGELGGIRFRDFDPDRAQLKVFGKGRKERVLSLPPLVISELRLALTADLPHLDRPPEADDYLIHPVDRRANGKGPEGQMLWSLHPRPKDPPAMKLVHYWWYRQLRTAGLVGEGVTSGLNMHQARHAFAMELRRVAGVEAASQALGHSDLSTTLGIYGHQDQTDLEQAMNQYGEWLEHGGL